MVLTSFPLDLLNETAIALLIIVSNTRYVYPPYSYTLKPSALPGAQPGLQPRLDVAKDLLFFRLVVNLVIQPGILAIVHQARRSLCREQPRAFRQTDGIGAAVQHEERHLPRRCACHRFAPAPPPLPWRGAACPTRASADRPQKQRSPPDRARGRTAPCRCSSSARVSRGVIASGAQRQYPCVGYRSVFQYRRSVIQIHAARRISSPPTARGCPRKTWA